MDPVFWLSLNFRVLACQKNLKIIKICIKWVYFPRKTLHKIWIKWVYFPRKILNNDYPFLPKWPLKMCRCFEARVAHPCSNQIWVPPGQLLLSLTCFNLGVNGELLDDGHTGTVIISCFIIQQVVQVNIIILSNFNILTTNYFWWKCFV